MITTVLLGVFVGLAALRRVIDPACPMCSGKSWGDGPESLRCARCGWSSRAGAPAEAPTQYEMPLK